MIPTLKSLMGDIDRLRRQAQCGINGHRWKITHCTVHPNRRFRFRCIYCEAIADDATKNDMSRGRDKLLKGRWIKRADS